MKGTSVHGSSTVRQAFAPPPGAVDCHMHIYDSRVPFCAGASLPHPDATVTQYGAIQSRLGLSRAVVVNPSAYGVDNRVTVAAIRAMGNTRGVAIVDPEISDEDLDALHAAGIRGARFNFHLLPAPSLDGMLRLVPRMAERGWHVQIGMRSQRIAVEAETLRAMSGTIVLEHCAGIPASATYRSDPAYAVVLRLIEAGRCWVKLSGPYLREPAGAPDYPLLSPFIRELVDRAPERLVWGSDWPHPTETIKPDDAALLALMADWALSAPDQRRILVSNPAKLYDFPALASPSERTGPC